MSKVHKRQFLNTLASIAQGQKEQKIFPETGRMPEVNPDFTDELEGIEGPSHSEIAHVEIGKPDRCSFCHLEKPPEELEREGSEWVCWDCLARFSEQERKAEEKKIKQEKRHK